MSRLPQTKPARPPTTRALLFLDLEGLSEEVVTTPRKAA